MGEISKTNKKLKKLKIEHDKHLNQAAEVENRIINTVFNTYVDDETRQNFLDDMKTYHFSEMKRINIEKLFSNYNKDVIDYNVAIDIIDAQIHIEEHSGRGFFSKIANVVIQDENN